METDIYWTFLIDIENKINYTGVNISGIHQPKNKIIGYQVVDSDYDIHPEMDASFCVYSLSQAREMIGVEKGVWTLLYIFANTIKDPVMMFKGNPND